MTNLVNRGMIILNDQDDSVVGKKKDDYTIIITGAARGGTSMLAQILDRLGLFLGDARDPVVLEDQAILFALQNFNVEALKSIIAERNGKFAKWGFKTPSLHNFLDVTDVSQFRNPRHIIVFRDPLAIARRMELSTHESAVTSFQEAGSELTKLTAYACALTTPALLISYEKALQNVAELTDVISVFCGLSPSAEQKAEAIASVNPNDARYIWATQITFWGTIDDVQNNVLRGWCCYQTSAKAVDIEVFADGNRLGIFSAEDYRQDLLNAGLHAGRHAFNIDLSVFYLNRLSLITASPLGHNLNLPNSGKSLAALRGSQTTLTQAYKYSFSIVACARWETQFIVEWLNYYQALGFDHVFLYCNDDDPIDLYTKVLPFTQGTMPFVTFRFYPQQGEQQQMYAHFLTHDRDKSEWISFFDIDEFLRLPKGMHIAEFIERFETSADCVLFNWVFFGPNGHKNQPGISILKEYRRREKNLHPFTKYVARSKIFNGTKLTKPNWHFPIDESDRELRIVNVLGEDMSNYNEGFPERPAVFVNDVSRKERLLTTSVIHHYAFRSESAFIGRVERGLGGAFSGQAEWGRKAASGADFDTFLARLNDVEDTTLVNFWAEYLHASKTLNMLG